MPTTIPQNPYACQPYALEPLAYSYDGLEPYINEETMRIHHGTVYKSYVDNLNEAIKKYPEYCTYDLEQLILGANYLPRDIVNTVYNNAGGVYNHQFYFASLTPYRKPLGESRLRSAIERDFSSVDQFKRRFTDYALGIFGAGWTWLTTDESGELHLFNLANEITPFSIVKYPLLCIDLWEHAYFTQYEAERADHITSWYEVVHWPEVEARYEQLLDKFKEKE